MVHFSANSKSKILFVYSLVFATMLHATLAGLPFRRIFFRPPKYDMNLVNMCKYDIENGRMNILKQYQFQSKLYDELSKVCEEYTKSFKLAEKLENLHTQQKVEEEQRIYKQFLVSRVKGSFFKDFQTMRY